MKGGTVDTIKEHTWVMISLGSKVGMGVVINVDVENERADVFVPAENEVYKRGFYWLQPIPYERLEEDTQTLIDMALDTGDEKWFKELCGNEVVEG